MTIDRRTKPYTEVPPNRAQPVQFPERADYMAGYMPGFGDDLNVMADEFNATAENVNSLEQSAKNSKESAEAAALVANSASNIKGVFIPGQTNALQNETWIYDGVFWFALTDTSTAPSDSSEDWASLSKHNSLTNRNEQGAHPASAIAGVSQLRDGVVQGRVFPPEPENFLKVGDNIPLVSPPFDHLRVGGELVGMARLATGQVTLIEDNRAVIGGTSVPFSRGFQLSKFNATQVDIERLLSNPKHNRCEISTLQTIDIKDLTIINRSELIGFGEDTILKLSDQGTAIVVSSDDPTSTALSNVTLKDFQLQMDFIPESLGINFVYASVQSALQGLRISNVGENSVGCRMSKQWYATTQRCSIRSTKREGSVGVLVTTEDGQVNNVPLDFQINGVETAVIVDTTHDYVYKLNLPETFHAERCDVGLRVKSGYGVRQAVIRGYFEANTVADCIWGDEVAGANDITQTVIWEGVSFNPNGSKVILYEGNHVFIGCDRLDVLEVHRTARVEIMSGVIGTIINSTGDSRRVLYRPTVSDQVSESRYANPRARMAKSSYFGQTTSSNIVTFDVVASTFGVIPTNGVTAECLVTSRRAYESSPAVRHFILTKSTTSWGAQQISAAGSVALTVSVNTTTGEITLEDTRGDTKVYDLKITPM